LEEEIVVRRSLILSLLFTLGLGLGEASAGTLYGILGIVPARLMVLDTDAPSSSWTTLGDLGVTEGGGGLAYDPSSDTLYFVDGLADPLGALYTLDQSTGAATLVGPFNIGSGPQSDLRGAAFDTSNGVLYAASGLGGQPGDLYAIDTTSGSANHIAQLNDPFPSGGAQLGGLAYDSKRDQLVWLQNSTGDLAVIDRSTGFATLLYDNPTTGASSEGLAYDPEKDLLWASDSGGFTYIYDPNNGYARTVQVGISAGITGLAYRVPVPVDMPALSPPALVLLAGLLLLSAAAWIARRQSWTPMIS